MITPDYALAMASYNAEMNRRLYDAAARLSDAERRRDRGAFWGSIHGTFSHLLWGDRTWMSRFGVGTKPDITVKQSPDWMPDFDTLRAARIETDARISEWAADIDTAWLAEELVWYSGASQREMRKQRALLVTHFFNHQTHHRGQAHAMITAAGEKTGDTDIVFIL
jgi:uncharacterized damage-inducible protein DinB